MKRFTDHPETIFGVLCEHSPDGVLLIDSNADIIHVNPTACRLFGYSPDEMQDKNFRMLLLKASDGATVTAFAGSAVSDLSLDEIHLKKKTGKSLIVDITLSGVTIDDERLAVVFLRDATQRYQLAQERRKNELLLSDVFNAIEDGISLLNRDLTVLRTNAWMEKKYSEMMPLVGKKCYEVYQQRTSPCPDCPSLITMKKGKPHKSVVPYPSEVAPEEWYELFAYPFKDLEGNITGVVEYVRNITEQKTLQKQLQESEARFRTFFENAQNFFYITSKEGRFISANKAGARLLGYSIEELLQLRVADTYANPEDRKHFVEKIEREGAVYDFPLYLKDKNGRKLSCRITSILIKDEKGNHIGYQGVINDFTEKERHEKETLKFETLLNQTSAAIVITDIHGSIDYVNPGFEKITGYSAEEARGQNPRILKSGRQDEAFYEGLWGTITSSRTWHGQFVNKRKDGSLYHEDAIIFPIKNTNGTIINFAAIKQDITKQVHLEKQLRQAAKLEAIGQLAGGIAHDFNNVLTSIKGFAEMGKAGEQATRIASQLLAFSRKQIIAPRVISANHVLREFEPVLTQLVGEDIDFLFTLCDKGDTIFADQGQIEQCVMNLVINARDAIRQKMGKSQEKKITIETLPVLVGDAYVKEHINIHKGPYVVIAVSDTGIGMDADTLSQIFDPFFTTKETGKGTGLGCSTIFGIVRQNNGNVRVYSEPGMGTTVKIYWPASDNETLLIAEDDEGIRNFVSQALEALGYTVYRAASGAEALKLVEEKDLTPDLLFTDVIMPGMDGTELAKALSNRIPHLKIIFSSGYTANHITHNGPLDKKIHFLNKPYSYRELASNQGPRNLLPLGNKEPAFGGTNVFRKNHVALQFINSE